MVEGDDGWYSIEVPAGINAIIINANEGSVQTADISVEVGQDVWITVADAENAAVSYEQPAGDAAEATPEPEASEAPAETAGDSGGSSAVIWIVVIVVIVAVITVAVVVSKKKKK